MDRIKAWLDFKGRSSRLSYWRMQIGLGLGAGLVIAATVLASQFGQMAGAIAFLPMALLVVLSLAVMVRRLHDRARSGFWALLFVGAPILSGALGEAGGMLLALASLGLSLWGLIEIGFLPGSKGDNAYGPPPAR